MQNVHFIEQTSFHEGSILLIFIGGLTADPGCCRSLKHSWKLTLWDSLPSCCCVNTVSTVSWAHAQHKLKGRCTQKVPLQKRLEVYFSSSCSFTFNSWLYHFIYIHTLDHLRMWRFCTTKENVFSVSGDCGFTTGKHCSGCYKSTEACYLNSPRLISDQLKGLKDFYQCKENSKINTFCVKEQQ